MVSMKKALITFALLCVTLLSVLIFNTLRFTSKQVQAEPINLPAIDETGAPQRLAQAMRFKTVSSENAGAASPEELQAFQHYLQRSFPRVHASLSREVIGGYSLLYTWKGSDDTLEPILLAAHMDVVPVEETTGTQWAHPPFDGIISEGYVWGRGSMDDKSSVLGILEAAEMLLAEGFQPRRTIYLAFGHDEEIGGKAGAASIAAALADRGGRLSYVLDEGMFIAEGVVPGVGAPVALVGIAEKGFLSLTLTVEAQTGHSSAPPPHTAIGVLSKAVNRLEENQFPVHVGGIPGQMFDYVGPEMTWGMKVVFANLWLFGPLVKRQLSASPGTNASIRTTTAVTVIEGGIKDNVLPSRARAIVNFRILPGDSIEGVMTHARNVIDDPRVKIEKYGDDFDEPSGVSNVDSEEFKVLQRTIRQVFPNAVVAPALVVGATDAKHYAKLTGNVYRFLPYRFNDVDISRLHGTNERLSVENYLQGVRFYYQLINNSTRR
jgi:carboxypeptidase PM20D1